MIYQKIIAILLLSILGIVSACGDKSGQVEKSTDIDREANTIEVQAFEAKNGWGYKIIIGGKLFINQDMIPSIAGNKGFKTKADALKVGGLVANKIVNNTFPIAVNKFELHSLEVEY